MTDKLPPGVYNAVIQGAVLGRKSMRMKLAVADALLTGIVMHEIVLNDMSALELRGRWNGHDIMIFDDVARVVKKRHYKAKPQPNCGPRSNNPW